MKGSYYVLGTRDQRHLPGGAGIVVFYSKVKLQKASSVGVGGRRVGSMESQLLPLKGLPASPAILTSPFVLPCERRVQDFDIDFLDIASEIDLYLSLPLKFQPQF